MILSSVLQAWCLNSRTVDSNCSADLQAIPIRCRSFCLPCELTAAILTIVYITPDAEVSSTLNHLQLVISSESTLRASMLLLGTFMRHV